MVEDKHLEQTHTVPSTKRVLLHTTPVLALGVLAIAAVVCVYLVTPVPQAEDPVWITVAALVAMGVLYIAAALAVAALISKAKHPLMMGTIALGVMISALIVLFALAYVSLSQTDPTNFNEPLTKISALYFTMTILSTVGFGDIYAVTEKARIVVMLQMVAGLTLFTVVARILTYVVKDSTKRRIASKKS